MDHKKDQEFEQTLAESELLLRGAARSASDDADLTLESILAEFGSREDGAEAAAEPEDTSAAGARTYTVCAGDTLWDIARRSGLSLETLIALNPQIRNPNLIYAGDTVNLA